MFHSRPAMQMTTVVGAETSYGRVSKLDSTAAIARP